MSINEVRYLPECGSTNAYVKEHFEEFGPVGAVYTENQTPGRGRLGRSWVNAEGKPELPESAQSSIVPDSPPATPDAPEDNLSAVPCTAPESRSVCPHR